jgi:hypothetical protein
MNTTQSGNITSPWNNLSNPSTNMHKVPQVVLRFQSTQTIRGGIDLWDGHGEVVDKDIPYMPGRVDDDDGNEFHLK